MASDFPAYVARNHWGYDMVERPLDATNGAAVVTGSFVFVNVSDGEVELCGADPAAILGLATGPYAARTIYPSSKMPFIALTPNCIIALCSATTPAVTHLQVLYGIAMLASGNWSVDTGDTSATKVQVVDIDITNGIFYCKPLAAALQHDAIVS